MKNYYILAFGILFVSLPSLNTAMAASVEINTQVTAEGNGSATIDSRTNTSITSTSSSSGSTTVSKKIEVTTNGQKKTVESNSLGTTSIDVRNGNVQIKELSDETDSGNSEKKTTATPTPTVVTPSTQAKDMSLGSMITYRVRLFLQKLFKF